MTTSAPGGRGAPVMIRCTVPGARGTTSVRPAGMSSATGSRTGPVPRPSPPRPSGPRSRPSPSCRSRAARRRAATSRASTRPCASARATSSSGSGGEQRGDDCLVFLDGAHGPILADRSDEPAGLGSGGGRRTEEVRVAEIDRMLEANEEWARRFPGSKPVRPARKVAVVACMDSRMPLFGMLGLEIGDAHVIRNAGGVITEDTIRSLTISQHAAGHPGDRAGAPHRVRAAGHRRRHASPTSSSRPPAAGRRGRRGRSPTSTTTSASRCG